MGQRPGALSVRQTNIVKRPRDVPRPFYVCDVVPMNGSNGERHRVFLMRMNLSHPNKELAECGAEFEGTACFQGGPHAAKPAP